MAVMSRYQCSALAAPKINEGIDRSIHHDPHHRGECRVTTALGFARLTPYKFHELLRPTKAFLSGFFFIFFLVQLDM